MEGFNIMSDKEILTEIHYENRSINRNIMRLTNIGAIGLLARLANNAKVNDCQPKKRLVRVGLLLAAIVEILIIIDSIADYRMYKEDLEEEDC